MRSFFAGRSASSYIHAEDFADRISGVTLDGVVCGQPDHNTGVHGSPRMVQRFDAGTGCRQPEPEKITGSDTNKSSADYPRYNENAYRAGLALQQGKQPGHPVKNRSRLTSLKARWRGAGVGSKRRV